MLKCALEMKGPSVCSWNRPGIEREMLSLMSTGFTLLPARRKGKESAHLAASKEER